MNLLEKFSLSQMKCWHHLKSWPKQNKHPKMYCTLLQFCSEMWTGQTNVQSLKEFFFLSLSERRSTQLHCIIPTVAVLCIFYKLQGYSDFILKLFCFWEKSPCVIYAQGNNKAGREIVHYSVYSLFFAKRCPVVHWELAHTISVLVSDFWLKFFFFLNKSLLLSSQCAKL